MQRRKRVWSGVLAIAIASSIVPLLSAPAANALGIPQPGGASIRTPGGAAPLSSGNSDTTFTVRLPAGAACGGDSANDGYRVQSYMVPASVDPATLTFDASGPVPNTLGAGFRQPLYDTTGSPFVNAQTANATTPPGPGPIINIPDFNYGAVFVPGNIPEGAYNIGIACTLGPASATQMKEFWNVTKTFTTNAATGGTAQVSWSVGAVPPAPTLDTVGTSDQTCTANFTPGAPAPTQPVTSFTATATGPGGPFTATGATSPIPIPGLANNSAYSVTVRATNTVGDSAESIAVSCTPNEPRGEVQNLTATPGITSVALNWDAPSVGPAPTGYTVTNSPTGGTTVVNNATTSAEITELACGTSYTFTVTPTYAGPPPGLPATISAFPFCAEVLQQQLQATRPVGVLVLTQVCGANGPLPLEAAQLGFPAGTLPAVEADTTGTAPFNGSGVQEDPATFAEYPYPVDDTTGIPNPTYPTNCGVNLGIGTLVTSGDGSGQFFRASAVLNQVSVVDTRDSDDGWTINGNMGAFTSGTNTFSGSQLGWTPSVTDDSDSFTDSSGITYDQVALAGPGVAPNTPSATGLSAGRELGHADAGSGLGIAVLDARLKLLIPVTANSGVYTGTLSITSV